MSKETRKYLDRFLTALPTTLWTNEAARHDPYQVPEEDFAHPVSLVKGSPDLDTMYLHETMQQPNRIKFIEAMEKQASDHVSQKQWKIVFLGHPSPRESEDPTISLVNEASTMESTPQQYWQILEEFVDTQPESRIAAWLWIQMIKNLKYSLTRIFVHYETKIRQAICDPSRAK